MRFYQYDTRLHTVNAIEQGGICFCFTPLDETKCLVSYVIIDRAATFKKKDVRRAALQNANEGIGFILEGDIHKVLSTFLDAVLADKVLHTGGNKESLKQKISACQSSFIAAEQQRISYTDVFSGMQIGPRYKVLSA